MKLGGWMSNPQYLAQVGHLFGAYAVAYTLLVGGIPYLGAHAYVFIALGIALAAVKEFVFDVSKWGEGDSWKDSAMDFAFYVIGAGLAFLVFFEVRHA
jgi:hypothetical protein